MQTCSRSALKLSFAAFAYAVPRALISAFSANLSSNSVCSSWLYEWVTDRADSPIKLNSTVRETVPSTTLALNDGSWKSV
jgi:hypothetical protein